MSAALTALHVEIDARVQGIRQAHPDWPCSRGCDACCRRLAEIPELTRAEWALLRDGLAALPAAQQAAIRASAMALEAAERPLVCPMLEQASGACTVYAHRPVACRSYGFYVQRGADLYCGDIEARVACGAWADVVWGNHEALDRRLRSLGERRTLVAWFASQDAADLPP